MCLSFSMWYEIGLLRTFYVNTMILGCYALLIMGPFAMGPFAMGPFAMGPFAMGPFAMGPFTVVVSPATLVGCLFSWGFVTRRYGYFIWDFAYSIM